MTTPARKNSSETTAAMKRKSKAANTPKASTAVDARTELADLVKRKAEIAVSIICQHNAHPI